MPCSPHSGSPEYARAFAEGCVRPSEKAVAEVHRPRVRAGQKHAEVQKVVLTMVGELEARFAVSSWPDCLGAIEHLPEDQAKWQEEADKLCRAESCCLTMLVGAWQEILPCELSWRAMPWCYVLPPPRTARQGHLYQHSFGRDLACIFQGQ